jgi:glycosyltransferase involved in cell wall biosynthesis
LRQIYLEHDVFILPSEYEGFPKVVYEAMIHGNIVVVSDLPSYEGIPDNAILRYPLGDCEALAELIKFIVLQTDKALQERRANATAFVSTFLKESTAEQLVRHIVEFWGG